MKKIKINLPVEVTLSEDPMVGQPRLDAALEQYFRDWCDGAYPFHVEVLRYHLKATMRHVITGAVLKKNRERYGVDSKNAERMTQATMDNVHVWNINILPEEDDHLDERGVHT